MSKFKFKSKQKTALGVFSVVCSVIATVFIVNMFVKAGTLDPSGAPGDTSQTLDDIYCAMAIDCTPGSYDEDSPGVASSTMHTLQEIYDKAVNFPLPDTGQETCYNAAGGEITCGQAPAGQDAEYTSANSFTCDLSYTDNSDGTVTDDCTGLMWVKEPQLIIPGAVGIHSTNQIQVAHGAWETSHAYALADLVKAEQEDTGVNASRDAYVVTASSGTPFSADDVGREIFINGVTQGTVKLFTSSTVVTVSATGTTGAAALTIQSYFVCSEAHTSGTFLTDLGASKWRETKWTASAANLTTPSTKRWDTQAIPDCEALEYAGHTDWRLPNVKELASIVNYGNWSPSIGEATVGTSGTGAPFLNTQSDNYWSSTTYAVSATSAWLVYFGSGSVNINSKTGSNYVRCVRQ